MFDKGIIEKFVKFHFFFLIFLIFNLEFFNLKNRFFHESLAKGYFNHIKPNL